MKYTMYLVQTARLGQAPRLHSGWQTMRQAMCAAASLQTDEYVYVEPIEVAGRPHYEE